MSKIGLFPLGLVLFPESAIPLHIFEQRYLNLVRDCIESDGEFGINLSLSSKIYDVGCTAKVKAIVREFDDGRLDITVAGVRRYRLKSFDVGKRLYHEAEIEELEDEGPEGKSPDILDLALLDECIFYFNQISEIVRTITIKRIEMNDLNTRIPSFLIAQKSGMSLKQKQELLEMRSENKRLLTLKSHLKEILPMLQKAENVNRLVRNDGFIIL